MAFNPDFFQPIGGQSRADTNVLADATTPRAPQLFSYLTTDAATTVDVAGYFNAVRDRLQVGDVILRATIDSSNALQSGGWHLVKDKTATSVDVADVQGIATTDSR